jgi:hypothetical protein
MTEVLALPGLIVPVDVWRFALDLEARGHRLSVTEDGKLRVTNGLGLTSEQTRKIEASRLHLLALAAYRYEPPRETHFVFDL